MEFFNLEMRDMTAGTIAVKDDGKLTPLTNLCEVIVTPTYTLVQRGKQSSHTLDKDRAK